MTVKAREDVLIPYLQGSLFRPVSDGTTLFVTCLNPLSTGKSVQTVAGSGWGVTDTSLNPLSTGKSVQTVRNIEGDLFTNVLIPYLQGSLFRRFK